MEHDAYVTPQCHEKENWKLHSDSCRRRLTTNASLLGLRDPGLHQLLLVSSRKPVYTSSHSGPWKSSRIADFPSSESQSKTDSLLPRRRDLLFALTFLACEDVWHSLYHIDVRRLHFRLIVEGSCLGPPSWRNLDRMPPCLLSAQVAPSPLRVLSRLSGKT